MKIIGNGNVNEAHDGSNMFLVNGLKKRSEAIFDIPITMN